MRSGTIAFLAGIVCLQQFQSLPDPRWVWLLLPAIPLALLLKSGWHLPAWLLAGFLWCLWQAHASLSNSLAPELEGRDVLVEGYIADLPEQDDRRSRFVFDVVNLTLNDTPQPQPGRLRLSWYGKSRPALGVGEKWRFSVRLKRPNGYMNPGGFDYEGWLFQQRIRATGYVRGTGERLEHDPPWRYTLKRFRAWANQQLTNSLQEMSRPGLIRALATGDRTAMQEQEWQVLRETGTAHLLAISGMHIGLVAALGFWLGSRLWRFSNRGMLLIPAPRVGALTAIVLAALYAALAGFAIPTQRALIMVGVVMWAVWRYRPIQTGRTLAWALLLVLLYDPFAVLSIGFWLSFVAVAWILYAVTGRIAPPPRARQWLRIQLWVTLGLLPLMLLTFQGASLVSPLANLLAIPLVSLMVVPLVLLGTLLSLAGGGAADMVLLAADVLLDGLLNGLTLLHGWPFAYLNYSLSHPLALLVLVTGLILLLAPRGVPARYLGVVGLLTLLWLSPPRPGPGEAWFTLLDVGQGLAAVVQTQQHVLVFDTGPRFGPTFDTGSTVVVPYLRDAGYAHIHAVIISHSDNDHIGGFESLADELDIDRVFTSVPDQLLAEQVMLCQTGQQWSWDGVRFEFLGPDAGSSDSRNNGSCVLRVSAGEQHILLPGDIEKQAEYALLHRHKPEKLQAGILVVPHHGSLTSSTPAFVAAVGASHVVYAVGYRNRYQFPRPAIQARYQQPGVLQYRSNETGALTFRLTGRGAIPAPQQHRQQARRYWHTLTGGSSEAGL